MKLKVTNVRTRSDVTIAWVASDDGGATLRGDADTTGKLLSASNSLSEDGLTMTTIQIWSSKQTYIDYLAIAEVAAVRTARAAYQIENLLGNTITYEEIE